MSDDVKKKVLIVGAGMIGHEAALTTAIAKLEAKDMIVVCSPTLSEKEQPDVDIILQEQSRPLDIHFKNYGEMVMPIYNHYKDFQDWGLDKGTTKGDLKRCKKGVHNYRSVITREDQTEGAMQIEVRHLQCIHCKKEIRR